MSALTDTWDQFLLGHRTYTVGIWVGVFVALGVVALLMVCVSLMVTATMNVELVVVMKERDDDAE